MRKLKLVLDDLDVDSFSVANPASRFGTVAANAAALPTDVETCETGTEPDTGDDDPGGATFDLGCPSPQSFLPMTCITCYNIPCYVNGTNVPSDCS
jgi:hypothetical protein